MAIDERDLGARVAHDVVELLAGEAQVERVDDAGAEVGRVVELEVLVAVGRHHREAVALAQPELAQRAGAAQDALAVLAIGRAVVAVDDQRADGNRSIAGRRWRW